LEVPSPPIMPSRLAAMQAGAGVAVLSLAIVAVAALAPVDSSTVATGVADITHSGPMTVTAIMALPAIMDVYRSMLMAVRSEEGALEHSRIMMRSLPSIVPASPQRVSGRTVAATARRSGMRGYREAHTVVEEE
jgi:hypothetical protein